MVDGRYQADTSDKWSVMIIGDDNWTDYTVSVDAVFGLKGVGGVSPRLILRYKDSRFMAAEWDDSYPDGGWSIILYDNNTKQILASNLATVWFFWLKDRITFQVKGDIYQLYIGDELVVEVQDDTLKTGRAGLGMRGEGSFVDFRINALP